MNGDITSAALRQCQRASKVISPFIIMRPSSVGGGRILRFTLSVRLSVCLSVCPSVPLSSLPSVTWRHLANTNYMYFSAGTDGIRTFRHALRAAYRTAISAAQILVFAVFDVSFRRYKL